MPLLIEVAVAAAAPTNPAGYAVEGVSKDGRYRFVIRDGDVIVWKTGEKTPVAHLSADKNAEARFVSQNLLVRWGCGVPCELAGLFTMQGSKLANLAFPVVSADERFALDVDVLDLKSGDSAVSVVDLRTGLTVTAKTLYPGLLLCAQTQTSSTEVVYSQCPGRDGVVRVPFSRRAPQTRGRARP